MATDISFCCTRCGNCCKHHGYVFLTDKDIQNLSSALGLSEKDFMQKYCKTVCTNGQFRVSLLERQNGDCLFITDNGCSVYEARPKQCQTFPYWEKITNDKNELARAKRYCGGIRE